MKSTLSGGAGLSSALARLPTSFDNLESPQSLANYHAAGSATIGVKRCGTNLSLVSRDVSKLIARYFL